MTRTLASRLQKKGATLVDYGILVGLLSVVSIGALLLTGNVINTTFEDAESEISSSQDATGGPQQQAQDLVLAPHVFGSPVTEGVPFSFDFNTLLSATGGYTPGTVTWSMITPPPALPLGIVLNPVTGVLGGTFPGEGAAGGTIETFTFTVRATDGVETVERTYTIDSLEGA